MTKNKPEFYEISALLQRQAEVFESIGDEGSSTSSLNKVINKNGQNQFEVHEAFLLVSLLGLSDLQRISALQTQALIALVDDPVMVTNLNLILEANHEAIRNTEYHYAMLQAHIDPSPEKDTALRNKFPDLYGDGSN